MPRWGYLHTFPGSPGGCIGERVPATANGGRYHVIMYRKQRPLLRTYRRSWGLTVGDLASLLGYRSTAHVSRLENGKRGPCYRTAIACTELFGAPLNELFPEHTTEAKRRLKQRALRLRERFGNTSTATAKRKCELLDQLCLPVEERASRRSV